MNGTGQIEIGHVGPPNGEELGVLPPYYAIAKNAHRPDLSLVIVPTCSRPFSDRVKSTFGETSSDEEFPRSAGAMTDVLSQEFLVAKIPTLFFYRKVEKLESLRLWRLLASLSPGNRDS